MKAPATWELFPSLPKNVDVYEKAADAQTLPNFPPGESKHQRLDKSTPFDSSPGSPGRPKQADNNHTTVCRIRLHHGREGLLTSLSMQSYNFFLNVQAQKMRNEICASELRCKETRFRETLREADWMM